MIGTDYLIDLNARKSEEFIRDKPKRQEWRRDGHAEWGNFECMDGRVNCSAIMGAPHGIMQSWRNIGGKFDVKKWPRLWNSVEKMVVCAKRSKRPVILNINSHYSRSEPKLGCKGHHYDIEVARAASWALKSQFDYYHADDPDVCVIQTTTETDEDAIIFHAPQKPDLDLGMVAGASESDIWKALRELYCRQHSLMSDRIFKDILLFAMRNLEHVSEVRRAKRPIAEAEHREWVLAVGQGFDWLRVPNTALIVGPFDPNFLQSVRIAGQIIAGNMQCPGFNKQRGVVILASSQFDPHIGPAGQRYAADVAKDLAYRAKIVLEQGVPELRSYLLGHLTVSVNMDTRRFNVLDGD